MEMPNGVPLGDLYGESLDDPDIESLGESDGEPLGDPI